MALLMARQCVYPGPPVETSGCGCGTSLRRAPRPSCSPHGSPGCQPAAAGACLAPLVPMGGGSAPVPVSGSEKLPEGSPCCQPLTELMVSLLRAATRSSGTTRPCPHPLPALQTFLALSEHAQRPCCPGGSLSQFCGAHHLYVSPRRV